MNSPASFWAKVDKSGGPDACWPWLGRRLASRGVGVGDYGLFGFAGRVVTAHRFAYEDTFGSIPEGLHVLHRCDNPPCCNPAHLFLGTELDNSRDKIAKGRERILKGEAVGNHKLTAAQAREIREKHKVLGLARPALARMYGVSVPTIGQVLRRRTWRDA